MRADESKVHRSAEEVFVEDQEEQDDISENGNDKSAEKEQAKSVAKEQE